MNKLNDLERCKEEMVDLIDQEQINRKKGKPTVSQENFNLWYQEMSDVSELIKDLLK